MRCRCDAPALPPSPLLQLPPLARAPFIDLESTMEGREARRGDRARREGARVGVRAQHPLGDAGVEEGSDHVDAAREKQRTLLLETVGHLVGARTQSKPSGAVRGHQGQ